MNLSLILYILCLNCFAIQDDVTILKEKLQNQVKCWNEGDIECFMDDYWKSEELIFIGKSGVTHGWTQTLENYKKSYPSKKEMGVLALDVIQVDRLDKNHFFVVGKWKLTREVGDVSGHFSLVWEKINGDWVIIADHSS